MIRIACFLLLNLIILQTYGQKSVCMWEVTSNYSGKPKYITESASDIWIKDSLFILTHSKPGHFYCIYRGNYQNARFYDFPDDSVLNIAGDTTFFFDLLPHFPYNACRPLYDSLPDGQWIKILRDSFQLIVIVEKNISKHKLEGDSYRMVNDKWVYGYRDKYIAGHCAQSFSKDRNGLVIETIYADTCGNILVQRTYKNGNLIEKIQDGYIYTLNRKGKLIRRKKQKEN